MIILGYSSQYIEVVAALIWDKDRFLICQRPRNKARALLWEFVGGKVEKGESKEEALIRECWEELAIDIAVDSVFTEVTHDYPDITVHLTLFNSRIVGGPIDTFRAQRHGVDNFVRDRKLRFLPRG